MSKWNRPMRTYSTSEAAKLTPGQREAREKPLCRTRAERDAARERILAKRREAQAA